MAIFNWLIALCWFIFILYWVISIKGIKKDVHTKGRFWNGMWLRLVFVVLVVLLVAHAPGVRGFFGWYGVQSIPFIAAIGVILCATGVGFAIWARRHLGKNWSPHPAMKEEHELVTSGPYRYVRHPIYTGMIAALLGSALVSGPAWFIIFIVFCAVIVWRINVEEGFMMQLFPQQYPEYKKGTKALIPFLF